MSITRKIMEWNWAKVDIMDKKRIASQTPTPGIEQIIDVPYIDDGTKPHLLDIYYPEGTTEKLPVIIDIHGGGWMYGYKEINKHFCLKLAEKGFLVASINYRLATETCYFEDQIKDIFASFKWLAENLKNYPADTDNVFLAGDSAGGHFTCVCTAVNESESMRRDFGVEETGLHFKAAGAICPATDLSTSALMRIMKPLLLGNNHKTSAYNKYMNIDEFATDKMPSFYIVTASGDFIRPQAYILAEALKKRKVEYTLHEFTETLNGKKLGHVFNVGDPYSVYGDKANTEMTEFFKSHM